MWMLEHFDEEPCQTYGQWEGVYGLVLSQCCFHGSVEENPGESTAHHMWKQQFILRNGWASKLYTSSHRYRAILLPAHGIKSEPEPKIFILRVIIPYTVCTINITFFTIAVLVLLNFLSQTWKTWNSLRWICIVCIWAYVSLPLPWAADLAYLLELVK